jgi:periplasmic protein CpxP/Spy
MKSNRNPLWATLLAAAAVLTAAAGFGLASAADDATSAPPPPPGAQGPHGRDACVARVAMDGHPGLARSRDCVAQWRGHGGAWHLLGKLGLSATQKQQVKDIMTAARPQMQSLHSQMQANSLKLRQTQPTDPNYTSISSQASQTQGSLAAQMMTQQAELRAQVFKVLTPAQQTQLAALEAQMPAHGGGHWGRRGTGPGPGSGADPAPPVE